MSDYTHQFTDGTAFPFPLGKIVCVGRNYAEHARELNNPIPTSPILFIKPATAAVRMASAFQIPKDQGAVHFETELALLIGQTLTKATPEQAAQAIAGYGLALDLTLRDLQSQLKEKGHPWEQAKAFDGACPLSEFVRAESLETEQPLRFELTIDGESRQQGTTKDMLTPILSLVSIMSQHFTLCPGDVVLTGTPKGVGPLLPGQRLHLTLAQSLSVETQVR